MPTSAVDYRPGRISDEDRSIIFDPLHFRNLSVKNRLFRSSISGRIDNYNGSGTRARINFEEQFAKGGVAIEIEESLSPAKKPSRFSWLSAAVRTTLSGSGELINEIQRANAIVYVAAGLVIALVIATGGRFLYDQVVPHAPTAMATETLAAPTNVRVEPLRP